MKNKSINLFEDEFEEEKKQNEIIEEFDNDMFEKEKYSEKDNGLKKLLQKSNETDNNLDSVLNSTPSQDLSDKSIFTFDNDEWNTMSKA